MFRFFHDKCEQRIFIKYVFVTILAFLATAMINFGLIAHTLKPVNIIIPLIIGAVTGILLAYNKLLQMRLVCSNNTKLQFLSHMNHELRTPMNAIIGFANLLQDSDNLTEEQKNEVRHILYAGNHTTALIAELLNFARIEMGTIHLNTRELMPSSVMFNSIEMVQGLTTENDITIENSLTEDQTATISADEVRLTEVFVNLLTNAIKYNRQNGKVKIDSYTSKGKLVIKISDTGIGIDKSQLPYLFEPFNRMGAEKTAIEGTGVGLAITRSLVEMMNGDIDCESELGKGTSFMLRFPLIKR